MSQARLKRLGKGTAVCLVTSTHVSANPRLVKEAEALAQDGFAVYVVAADVNGALRSFDQAVLENAEWDTSFVRRPAFVMYALLTLLQHACRKLLRWQICRRLFLASRAHNRLTARFAAAAAKVPARLFIAHNLAALPAAAIAARMQNARFAFDAEDFHTQELTAEQRNAGDQVARGIIERMLLPECAYRSAASPMIAEAYNAEYGVKMTPILNVFALSGAPAQPSGEAAMNPRSLYWFSQTIGPGRGLDEILAAIGLMKNPPHVYLRGRPAAGYVEQLMANAQTIGGGATVTLLAPAPPTAMVSLSANYTLGLAIEPGSSPNNLMALSNKLFTYLLAGVPVLLSRTPAHESISRELGAAAIVVDVHDRRATADALERFLDDTRLQHRARGEAWRLGRERFNWESERSIFLAAVTKALAPEMVNLRGELTTVAK